MAGAEKVVSFPSSSVGGGACGPYVLHHLKAAPGPGPGLGAQSSIQGFVGPLESRLCRPDPHFMGTSPDHWGGELAGLGDLSKIKPCLA